MKQRHYPLYHDPLAENAIAGLQGIDRIGRRHGCAVEEEPLPTSRSSFLGEPCSNPSLPKSTPIWGLFIIHDGNDRQERRSKACLSIFPRQLFGTDRYLSFTVSFPPLPSLLSRSMDRPLVLVAIHPHLRGRVQIGVPATSRPSCASVVERRGMVAIAHLLASKTAAKCPDGVPIAFWVPLHHGEFVMPDVISALSPGTERRPIIDLAGGECSRCSFLLALRLYATL